MYVVDFAAVHADDAYLDELGSAEPVEPTDALAALLLAWRSAVDAVPIPEVLVWPNGWAA